jgi:DNA-directed RNA polymerase specialized sigma24 family protein
MPSSWAVSAVLICSKCRSTSTAETAQELGISEEAAKKRHFRALKRLKALLTSAPGEQGDPGL